MCFFKDLGSGDTKKELDLGSGDKMNWISNDNMTINDNNFWSTNNEKLKSNGYVVMWPTLGLTTAQYWIKTYVNHKTHDPYVGNN